MESAAHEGARGVGPESGYSAVCVAAHDGVRLVIAEMLDAAGIVHQRDGGLVRGNVGKGLVRPEVSDSQIAQPDQPERVAVDIQDRRFVAQNRDSAGLHAVREALEQMTPPAA